MEFLNNFKAVEAKYNSIKPVVSKNHTLDQDIRPIGERRYKWQRIKKLSDNCYAFLDGYSYGDDVFRPWWFDAKDPRHNTYTEGNLRTCTYYMGTRGG